MSLVGDVDRLGAPLRLPLGLPGFPLLTVQRVSWGGLLVTPPKDVEEFVLDNTTLRALVVLAEQGSWEARS